MSVAARRRHARAGSGARPLPRRARAAGRRARRRRELPAARRPPGRADRERAAARLRGQRRTRDRGHEGAVSSSRTRTPGRARAVADLRASPSAPALRDRGPPAALPRRALAAVAAPLPDRERDARPADAAAAALRPEKRQRAHYLLDERPDGAGPGRLDARRVPAPAARDARRARRLRRGLPPLRRGHRPLLPGREGRLGALVRARRGRHACARGSDRPPLPHAPHLWHWRGIGRFVRKHPERLRAL